MRVSNDRYSRDLRSIDLARRMLGHEARTQTIHAWTGLTGDRIRNLARSHASAAGGHQPHRHRGPSPSRLSAVLCTVRLRDEAAALAGLCRVLGVFPERAMPDARSVLPTLIRGERLCTAYDLFRQAVPQGRMSFEQLVLLVLTVAEGDSWALDHCTGCHGTILVDRLEGVRRTLCTHCASSAGSATEQAPATDDAKLTDPGLPDSFVQERLFD